MSFGFSIGDFLAVGKLVAEIITSLQDAGGAKSDYQELIRELECLGKVLRRLDELQAQNSNTKSLESIKYAALSCQRPLEDFLGKMKRYEDTLGKKEEVARLQGYLSVHIGTINILLDEHGLESLQAASGDAEVFHMHVRDTLHDMRRTLSSIEENSEAQRHAVEANNSMLTRLCQVVCGDISTGVKALIGVASTVCVMTQQIYVILLELKSSPQAPDTRWTWFQEPFKVEDALGVKFPIPAEYSFDLIQVIIKTRFKNGPGSQDVQLGNYELVQAHNSTQAISVDTFLRPGTHIIMAIIIDRHSDGASEIACPIWQCGSTRTTRFPGGGRVCSECQTWFGESNRERKRVEDVLEQENGQRQGFSTGSRSGSRCKSDSKPLERSSLSDEQTGAYKNVRYSKLSSTPNKENARDNDKEDAPGNDKEYAPGNDKENARFVYKFRYRTILSLEDITEDDIGYDSDTEIVRPDGFEDLGRNKDEADILGCLQELNYDDDSVDTDEELRRRLERKKRRWNTRPFRRTHSQIVGSDTDDDSLYRLNIVKAGSGPRRLRRKPNGEKSSLIFEGLGEADNEEERGAAPNQERLQPLPFWVLQESRTDLDSD